MIETSALPNWLSPAITPAETAVVDLISRRFKVSDPTVLAAVALTVLAQREGHSCVNFNQVAELVRHYIEDDEANLNLAEVPTAETLISALRLHSEIVQTVGEDLSASLDTAQASPKPFVLFENYLYTQRQFVDELSIALQISTRSHVASTDAINDALIDQLVPKPEPNDEAATKAGDTGIANRTAKSFISRRFTVLTGGPGTGKTFTLTRCLAALLATRENQTPPKLALVAPTGKAATRAKDLLVELVASQRTLGKDSLGLPDAVLEQLDRVEPRTIHRVLGSKGRQRTRFAHDATRPLDIDVLIVDEMSMVPSALMARLLEAMRPDATILLVGDQAQLEAVESGSVLREIVELGQALNATSSFTFELLRVWRQGEDTKIGDLAREIRAGKAPDAVKIVAADSAGITHVDSVGTVGSSDSPLNSYLTILKEVRTLAESTDSAAHQQAYEKISKNKLLCGPRQGKLGINHWNTILHESIFGSTRNSANEAGVPLLVTVNSARSRLVNGDIGLVVNTTAPDGTVTRAVYFPDGAAGRYLSPAQLPPVEVCFAMTIHKSQGSEYDNLTVILPGEDSPLLNRELVYTAITRAKQKVTIIGRLDQLAHAINNRSSRFSGLGSMIRKLS